MSYQFVVIEGSCSSYVQIFYSENIPEITCHLIKLLYVSKQANFNLLNVILYNITLNTFFHSHNLIIVSCLDTNANMFIL